GGDSYKQVNFENGASTYAYDPLDSNTIYVGSTFLNQSKDGGETWKRLFPAESDVKRAQYSGDHAGYRIEVSDSSLYDERYTNIGAIRADPIKSGSIYFSMGPLFFYTSDFGKTWKKEELDQSIHYL